MDPETIGEPERSFWDGLADTVTGSFVDRLAPLCELREDLTESLATARELGFDASQTLALESYRLEVSATVASLQYSVICEWVVCSCIMLMGGGY